MDVYSASVALLWTTAMRATTPVTRVPRPNRGAVAPSANGSMDEAPHLGRHCGDYNRGRSHLDNRG